MCCAHIGETVTGQPPEDDEINVILPSRHMTRNSCLGGLRPTHHFLVTGVTHNSESLRVNEEETFVSLKPE